MKNKLYHIFFFLCILTNIPTTKAQQTGVWTEAAIEYDLPKGFEFDLGGELRTDISNATNIDKFFPELGLSYKINKHFDVSVAYRYIMQKEDNGYFYNRNKWIFDLSSDLSVKRLSFANRVRFNTQKRAYIEDVEDLYADNYFRDKVTVKYNIRKTPIEPYCAFEVFVPYAYNEIQLIDEIRIGTGISFPVAKKQDMNVGILYINEMASSNAKSYLLSISYSLSVKDKIFKSKKKKDSNE